MESNQKKKGSPQKNNSAKSSQPTSANATHSKGVCKKSNPVSGLNLKLYRIVGT